ncbi:MAG: glycosyltransferase family 4 protein [Butyrivibrio sp.]|nr:glycosyltransferase family 4 protein [Butyrivibrio sp.]
MDSKKKIVFAIDTNMPGGAERVVVNLANQMAKMGIDTTIINSDNGSCFFEVDKEVSVVKMNLHNGVNYAGRALRFAKKTAFLKRYFKREDPDLVIAFLPNMEIPAIIAGFISGKKVFTSIRSSLDAYPFWVSLFRRIAYPHIGGVVLQSQKVYDDLCIPGTNKTVIPNPISVGIRRSEMIPALSERNNHIVNVGRLIGFKNHELLIDAFDELADIYPGYELHIYGDGELWDQLSDRIKSKRNSSNIMLHHSESNVIEKNRCARMFVSASETEGFPNAVVEAMASGIPILCASFDKDVVSSIIHNGDNGIVCEISCDDLVAKMQQMLEMSETQTDALVKSAIESCQKYGIEEITNQWLEFVYGH